MGSLEKFPLNFATVLLFLRTRISIEKKKKTSAINCGSGFSWVYSNVPPVLPLSHSLSSLTHTLSLTLSSLDITPAHSHSHSQQNKFRVSLLKRHLYEDVAAAAAAAAAAWMDPSDEDQVKELEVGVRTGTRSSRSLSRARSPACGGWESACVCDAASKGWKRERERERGRVIICS